MLLSNLILSLLQYNIVDYNPTNQMAIISVEELPEMQFVAVLFYSTYFCYDVIVNLPIKFTFLDSYKLRAQSIFF